DLSTNNTLVLSTPPGAGKSTIVPLALLDAPWLQGRKIVMLEPRRLAASSIAHRMAALLGEDTGETVGYRVRFENQTSSHTRIEVVTEGILTRMLHQDNALEDVASSSSMSSTSGDCTPTFPWHYAAKASRCYAPTYA